MLAQLGLDCLDSKAGVEMTIEDGALVLRRSTGAVRIGWAKAAMRIAEGSDAELLLGDLAMPRTRSWSGDAWKDLVILPPVAGKIRMTRPCVVASLAEMHDHLHTYLSLP